MIAFSQNKNGETYHTYGYTNAGWSDLLTSFDGGTITYDAIGNPLTYHDGKTFTWTAGRKLSTVTDGDSNYTYAYDGDGNRISKTVDGVTTDYYYIDGKLLGLKKGQDTLLFLYDETGTAYGFLHNGTLYYYDINLQGDVVGIYNGSGNLVASYTYDVWGAPELTSDNAIATLNPLRYRGYFYDEETGFYYVSSRYYDPVTCRFINADSVTDGGAGVLGYHLFIYAANNPMSNSDPSGHWIIKNAIKWLAKNVVKPVVKVQKTLSKVNATRSRGVNISGSPGAFSFNLQAGVSVDTKGNVAIQSSYSGGVTGGSPGASITTYKTVTNAPSIKKLEGPGYQIGGSVAVPVFGVPLAAGADLNIIPDTELNKTYYGATSNVGLGTPGGEIHAEWGETVTWDQTQFNVFDVAKTIYIKIMEW